MSSFHVTVERLTISPHPNADRIELAQVGDYQSIVRKGQFKTGELGAYIPEASIVPEAILEELGLQGKLAGSQTNRVKAVRLRGVLSQGIIYPAHESWVRGQDVTDLLGITKYEPPVPVSMSGELYSAGFDRCMRYDIENIKRYPGTIAPGERVIFTEKLHGTWCQLGVIPQALAGEEGRLVVTSKGLGSKGLAFKPGSPANLHNLYLRVARHLGIEQRLGERDEAVFVLGEVFGSGVQDLGYGASTRQDESLGFRVFDVYEGLAGHGRYLDHDELEAFCTKYELERVPILYEGPFSREVLLEMTDGPETVSGEGAHMREGLVVRPVVERRDEVIGRVQLKSISEDYLLRRGGTEYT